MFKRSLQISFAILIHLLLSISIVMAQTDICPALVTSALSQFGTDCANLGGNSACYGFSDVRTVANEASITNAFSNPGDRIELTDIESIQTSPLDPSLGRWGVSLLNIQGTSRITGSNRDVRLIMLGDVEVKNAVTADALIINNNTLNINANAEATLYNAPGRDAKQVALVSSGTTLSATGITPNAEWVRVVYEGLTSWVRAEALDQSADLSSLSQITFDSMAPMQAFNFRTGSAVIPECANAETSLLVVQGPADDLVEIVANGTQIRFTSTILLRTLPNNKMEVIAADGFATLNVDSTSEILLQAGGAATVALNESGNAEGAWADWRVMSQTEIDQFGAVEKISENLLQAPIQLPSIADPSGIGQPPVIIIVPPVVPPGPPPVVPPGRPPVVPPIIRIPFPQPPLRIGIIGQDLPAVAWNPFDIGGPSCPPWIAYHTDRTGDWEVFRLGGTGNENLSQGTGASDIQMTRSIDAEWVAFTSNRESLTNWELFVTRSNGTDLRRVTFNTGVDINPSWGPGTTIAFESNRDGNWEIYMFDVSGGGQAVRLTDDPGNDINPDWSSDGGSVVFLSDRDGDWEIYMLNIATNELTQLTDNDVDDLAPSLSEDGTMITWIQENSFGVFDLWVMNLQTNELTQLTDFGTNITRPVFSPENDFVLFESNAEGSFDVFAVDLATGTIKNITPTSDIDERAPGFRCVGSAVIYQSDFQEQWDLYQVNPLPITNNNVPASTRLTNTPAADFYPMNTPSDEDYSREGRLPN